VILLTILDILIVAVLAYAVLLFLRRTHSTWVFRGVVALVIVAFLASALNLKLTHTLFSAFFSIFVVALVMVFHRELRIFFEDIGLGLSAFFTHRRAVFTEHPASVLAETVRELAERGVGALIVLPGRQPVERYLEGGYRIAADVSPELILSIFDTNTPGHDGAMVIEGNEIRRFAVQLPLAHKPPSSGRRQLGTRHSAGLGLSERSDALVIIVSEERATISLAEKGSLRCIEGEEDLEQTLADFFTRQQNGENKTRFQTFFATNLPEKGLAILFALLSWYFLIYR